MARSGSGRKGVRTGKQKRDEAQSRPDRWLAPVYLNERKPGPRQSSLDTRCSDKGFLPMQLEDYLKLVDWTRRQIVSGKRGRIPDRCKPILERLGLSRQVWCDLVKDFGRLFGRVAGRPKALQQSAESGGVTHRRSHGGPAMLAT